MTTAVTERAVTEEAQRRTWPHSSGGWWAVGLSVAALACWLVLAITGWWGMVAVATVVTVAAIVVDMMCLSRWDDSILTMLAAAGTALLALVLIVTLVGTIATTRLG